MFISSKEKAVLWMTIEDLKSKIRDLEIEVVWLKNKATKHRIQIAKTGDAPWGIKKDGSPKKRPGRPPHVLEVSA
jgi:hypothetical protein